jgi:putative ABC transport system ATP-binding protein
MLVDLKNIQKSYGDQSVLAGVDLQLAAGHSMALTGESGSGKSTLLHLIGGLDHADAGEVSVAGESLQQMDDAGRAALRRTTVAVVFQQFNLIPSLNVAANLSFQARLAERYDCTWTKELIDRLGLIGLEQRYPEQLSGGQQQRVAIGRALAVRPALILADEPTGNLDEDSGDAVMSLLLDLVRDTGAGLLMVTHSQRLAARLDRRLMLAHGRIV